jgi:hypothetical protein
VKRLVRISYKFRRSGQVLFAILQGLPRLEEIDPDRVGLPPIMRET